MNKLIQEIEDALRLEDQIDRMELIDDISLVAKSLYEKGCHEEAKEVFLRLQNIDEVEYDDLLQTAAALAEEYLIKLGVIVVPTFQEKYGKILGNSEINTDQRLLISTAKEIYDNFPKEPAAIEAGYELMEKASSLGTLNKKEQRLLYIYKGLYEKTL